jgi:hypothetical protein
MAKGAVSILLLMSLFCLAVAAAENPSTADQMAQKPCELTSSDYKVFGVLLARLHQPSRGKILVLDITIGTPEDQPPMWAIRPESKGGPSQKIFDNFLENEDTACTINSGFGDTKSYSLIAPQDVNEFLDLSKPASSDSWETFHRKYKSAGFYRFSRPSYNSAQTEALVQVALSCGPLCGGGTLYLLSKQEGEWTVKNRTLLWLGIMLGDQS